MGASEADAYVAELIWYGIGVAETLFQIGLRVKESAFVEALALHGTAGVRRMLFTQTIKELDVHLIRKGMRGW
jgi:hypothetical protein